MFSMPNAHKTQEKLIMKNVTQQVGLKDSSFGLRMRRLTGRAIRLSGILAALSVVSIDLSAQACPGGVCPPITVTGPTTAGSNILCRGMACANILQGMQAASYMSLDLSDQQAPIGPEDVPVSQTEFCRNLRTSKPVGCGITPAPVPGVNTTFQVYAAQYGNGCGDGSWSVTIANAIAQASLPGYSGNPDAPFAGISFRGACNAHDACYAGQGVRGTCDTNLYNSLAAICATAGSVATTCNGYAHAFAAAVSLGGQAAYTQAYLQQQCALWHKNMETNACPK
jgi:hypothetical protein